ncbi:hypothetical protein [Vannielia litorea]|uniref:hypothetical protein n=1 Tax=Vannielia litorea TaxID=1217970 RepID=UPI001BCBAC20|nr:hypothetical protein [Vannielia litorea]MBS8227709.1 hypothetical protein [Vannielia litorea]
MIRRAAPLALAAALLSPASLSAEGARITLDCGFQQSCSEAGQCSPYGGSQVFTLAPENTDVAGSGDWTIALGETAPLPARGLSRTGPWTWQRPGDGHLHSLVLTGTDSAMWVRQWLPTELYPETYAEVDFMLCEVTG